MIEVIYKWTQNGVNYTAKEWFRDQETYDKYLADCKIIEKEEARKWYELTVEDLKYLKYEI